MYWSIINLLAVIWDQWHASIYTCRTEYNATTLWRVCSDVDFYLESPNIVIVIIIIEEEFKKRQNKRSSLSTILILDIKYKSNVVSLSICLLCL